MSSVSNDLLLPIPTKKRRLAPSVRAYGAFRVIMLVLIVLTFIAPLV